MAPDTAMDLGFHYFSSQMRYSSMFRNAPGLKYITSLVGINCLQICLMERRMASVGLPRKGKPIYKRSFLGPNLIGARL